jgi:hypothetical protein
MIFFLRLNAILSFLFAGGLQILEDVSTWKLIKQFHRRANAKPRDLLTLRTHRTERGSAGSKPNDKPAHGIRPGATALGSVHPAFFMMRWLGTGFRAKMICFFEDHDYVR